MKADRHLSFALGIVLSALLLGGLISVSVYQKLLGYFRQAVLVYYGGVNDAGSSGTTPNEQHLFVPPIQR
ncbi:MAG: hypothetical protein KF753_06485 [Caldilineaceae bacterium]|nr:hypothetical protein [Caldilineaceae bacterium]